MVRLVSSNTAVCGEDSSGTLSATGGEGGGATGQGQRGGANASDANDCANCVACETLRVRGVIHASARGCMVHTRVSVHESLMYILARVAACSPSDTLNVHIGSSFPDGGVGCCCVRSCARHAGLQWGTDGSTLRNPRTMPTEPYGSRTPPRAYYAIHRAREENSAAHTEAQHSERDTTDGESARHGVCCARDGPLGFA